MLHNTHRFILLLFRLWWFSIDQLCRVHGSFLRFYSIRLHNTTRNNGARLRVGPLSTPYSVLHQRNCLPTPTINAQYFHNLKSH
uniref:Putative secreted protein n=1 Tax=Anopheles darlingi TaxID=43151 RepID=A0A2M4D5W3_ANODA